MIVFMMPSICCLLDLTGADFSSEDSTVVGVVSDITSTAVSSVAFVDARACSFLTERALFFFCGLVLNMFLRLCGAGCASLMRALLTKGNKCI